MKLVDTEGKPVLKYTDDMVGGSQEDPVLEWKSREIHIPAEPIGTRFRLQADSMAMAHWYKVITNEIAKRISYKESAPLEKLWQSIRKDEWIGEDFIADRRAKLKELTKPQIKTEARRNINMKLTKVAKRYCEVLKAKKAQEKFDWEEHRETAQSIALANASEALNQLSAYNCIVDSVSEHAKNVSDFAIEESLNEAQALAIYYSRIGSGLSWLAKGNMEDGLSSWMAEKDIEDRLSEKDRQEFKESNEEDAQEGKLASVATKYNKTLKMKCAQEIPTTEVEGSPDAGVRNNQSYYAQLTNIDTAITSLLMRTKTTPFVGEPKAVENMNWLVQQLVSIFYPPNSESLTVRVAKRGLSEADAQKIKEYVKELVRELKDTTQNAIINNAIKDIYKAVSAYEAEQILPDIKTKELTVSARAARF